MLGLYKGEYLDVIFNTVMFISKWEIMKIRNKVKYKQSRIGDQTIFNICKQEILDKLYYDVKKKKKWKSRNSKAFLMTNYLNFSKR